MRKINRIMLLLLSLSLIIGLIDPVVYADDSKQVKANEPTTLAKIKVKENVTAEVKNVQVVPSDNHQVVSLTLTIDNNSNTELNLIDYWVNISTKSGAKLTVQSANPGLSKIPAKSKMDLIYFSTVNSNLKASDLIIKVVQWDFSVSSTYTRVLGEVSVPLRYNPVIPAGSGSTVVIDNVKASFVVNQSVIGESDNYYRPDIKLQIRNDGNQAITLPDYQFYIMTKNKLMYPITVQNLKGTILNPLTEKEFQLTVSIPNKVETDGWSLVVMHSVNEGKGKISLAQFELPKASVSTGEELGKFYTFNTTKGIYSIKLDSLNRLPLEDDDLIIANLTLANKGKETLPLPSITGKYIFNESIEKAASISQNNKIIALQPGQTVNIQFVGKVPYTFDISKLKLFVQQKESNGEGSEEAINLVAFDHDAKFSSVKKVNSNVGFKVEDLGYRSTVTVRNLKQYNGVAANVIAAQVIIENNEKRQAIMQKLAGYFEKSDGTIYPASFEYLEEKLAPGGKAIINAWTTVPNNIDINDINLVIGKAIVEIDSGGTASDPDKEQLVGYASPYAFTLPSYSEVQDNLQDIDLLSYQFSITRIATQIWFQERQVKFNFDYKLSQDLLTKSNFKDHKMIIEIQDANPKSVFSKEISFPNSSTGSNEQNAELKVGEHTMEIVWSDLELVDLITTLKDYQLNVYYQITPGYKTLIATQKLPWLVNRSLN